MYMGKQIGAHLLLKSICEEAYTKPTLLERERILQLCGDVIEFEDNIPEHEDVTQFGMRKPNDFGCKQVLVVAESELGFRLGLTMKCGSRFKSGLDAGLGADRWGSD